MENNTAAGSDEAKDLPATNPNQEYKGQEGENHSTASEGTLKTPHQLPKIDEGFKENEEQDMDDLVHSQGGQATPLNEEDKFTPDDISS